MHHIVAPLDLKQKINLGAIFTSACCCGSRETTPFKVIDWSLCSERLPWQTIISRDIHCRELPLRPYDQRRVGGIPRRVVVECIRHQKLDANPLMQAKKPFRSHRSVHATSSKSNRAVCKVVVDLRRTPWRRIEFFLGEFLL